MARFAVFLAVYIGLNGSSGTWRKIVRVVCLALLCLFAYEVKEGKGGKGGREVSMKVKAEGNATKR